LDFSKYFWPLRILVFRVAALDVATGTLVDSLQLGMAGGLSEHVWTIKELIEKAAGA
jgi:hypothetical protein